MKYTFFATISASILFLSAGCASQFVKPAGNEYPKPGAAVSKMALESTDSTEDPALWVPGGEINGKKRRDQACGNTLEYRQEDAELSTILDLYHKARKAFEREDFYLAEINLRKAAVLSSRINISSIDDEALVLRYINTLSSTFQCLGNTITSIDQINREDPLKWLDQLSKTKSEAFKTGKWTDDELRKIIGKIALRCDMPVVFNDSVKKSIYFFQTVGRKTMERWISKSGRFMPLIKEIFKAQGLPQDLAYLAMIESGFNCRAYSHKHCSGLWQFGALTGQMYGLKRTQWIDPRYDPVKSTKASAHYLSDLYQVYDDWLLVMAAYNWGPTNVNRRIKAGSTDFWSMKIPRETKNYVPSFMAAVLICKAPELFGFENIKKQPPMVFDTVEVSYTSLKAAARCAGTDLKTIKSLNTELIKSYTPPGQTYTLRIPGGSKSCFLDKYAKLPKEKYRQPAVDRYHVRKGDTLSGVARMFSVSINSLMNKNHIKNRHRLKVGQRLQIPGSGDKKDRCKKIVYVIKKEDTLYDIALKYNVSYRKIMRWNNIKNHRTIKPGQKIIIKSRS